MSLEEGLCVVVVGFRTMCPSQSSREEDGIVRGSNVSLLSEI